jgi:three-Cys-motif partner protein
MTGSKPLITSVPIEADPAPHLVVDLGKDGLGVGSWVASRKHPLLATYINAAWAAARRHSHWVLIDPFCGPGRMRQRDETFTRPGGAAIAWRQSQLSGTPFGRVLVGDLDEERVSACQERLRLLGAPVEQFAGPADKTVPLMVKAVPRGALCLVYIDPYNLALLSHSMIAALAKLPKVDFVVHFSTMDMLRNVDHELDPKRARFDTVSPGWRERIGNTNKRSMPSWFFNDWHQQVKALGFEFSNARPLVHNDDAHELYKLVFFARHPLPIKLWNAIADDRQRGLEGF